MTIIAENSGDLADFGPYVPAIDDSGRVVFFASRVDGSQVIVEHPGTPSLSSLPLPARTIGQGEGGPDTPSDIPLPLLRMLVPREGEGLGEGVPEITSHPDMNSSGQLTFYGKLRSGRSALFLDGVDVTEDFASIGPLGPTMNESGAVAFRGEQTAGKPGIFLLNEGRIETVAEAGDEFAAFHGLPVVNDSNQVAFRADLTSGCQGVFLWKSGHCHLIADTGGEFETFGFFPSLNHAGTLAFGATKGDGWSGIVHVDANGTHRETSEKDWNFRGALINGAGHEVVFATPPAGNLGIYTGEFSRLLGIGDPYFESVVTELALNSVSINETGQIAVRVKLQNARQFILRIDLTPTDGA